jgi:hypothetical protein
MTEWFSVTTLGDQDMILGLPWLEKFNPVINWKQKILEFQDSDKDKEQAILQSMQALLDALPEWEEDLVVQYLMSPRGSGLNNLGWSAWPNTLEMNIGRIMTFDTTKWSEDDFTQVIRRYTPAQRMEHKYHQTEEVTTLPPEYNQWKDIFEKKASEQFPESRSWDHQIELNETFVPKRGKLYLLSLKQQNTLDEWIKEHLEKGYI